jgi:sodium-dependent dicarboxylate transporter 2/3/5
MSTEEEEEKLTGKFRVSKFIEFVVTVVITLIVWNLPSSCFGIEGLTIVQQRVIAIFVFATLMWLTEAVPAWATSIGIITLMLLTVSNNGISLFRQTADPNLGTLISSKDIMATFADPIIILFLGGFILAIAASKSHLDMFLAKTLLRPFGTKSENVLLGFIMVTGIFSMFVSNTATAAMMLTFLAPLIKVLPPEGKGRVALTLSIPVAANLGGMATPIGTPPNAIALKFLNNPEGLNLGIGFGQWMSFMLPLVLILLFISWILLKRMFPFKQKTINLVIEGNVEKNWRTIVTEITFVLTIVLWMLDKVTGIDANTVAMIPICVFGLTGVITARDLQKINWSVIWMVAGGFALGLGLEDSGLAKAAIKSIPFGDWSPIVIILVSSLICYFLSNFISNTATAALLIPILATVCTGMGGTLKAVGGPAIVLIGIAIAASSAMSLPISTPPNAIASSTGLVKQKDMLRIGLTVGIISLLLGFGTLYLVGKIHLI